MKFKKIKQDANNTIFIFVFILSLFFAPKISYAKNLFFQMQDQIMENTQRVENIEIRMIDLKDNYRLLYDGAKNQNDQLGNLISFSSFILAFFGIFLVLYVNRQYKKIKEMKEIVEDTKQYIDKHNKQLYIQIKRDETIELLNRLKEVPEDITNLCQLLLSRDLLEEDYLRLKESYLKARESDYDLYIVLFMQHFPFQSLKDSDLKDKIISNIDSYKLNQMFNRDIENLFDGVFKYIKEFGINDEQNKTIIKNLFYNYYKSEFQSNVALQDFIKNLFLKYSLEKTEIFIIAKEHTHSNKPYTEWIDSTFNF